MEKLRKKFTVLYTKGLEKSRMLEQQYGLHAFNLDCVLCPNIMELPEIEVDCNLHHSKHCALAKAVAYAEWLKE